MKAATGGFRLDILPNRFQSTPPVKAATFVSPLHDKDKTISIHAAREGGDVSRIAIIFSALISIHAAREGGDFFPVVSTEKSQIFQSTPPVKAATLVSILCLVISEISIHAAREGGDVKPAALRALLASFQSTPPVKAATSSSAACLIDSCISIHAAREGGDVVAASAATASTISIHAAREGGDHFATGINVGCKDFNPRRP